MTVYQAGTGAKRALLCALALLTISARAEPTAQMLADTCAMCHGTDGKSAGVLDSLQGKSARELEREMLEFKRAGKGRIMAPIARAYSDAQIRQIAEYLGSRGGKK
ncbi:MAG TPA: c-type cytochrome [Burkholderiales bacterium]|nr:c-type cytochrome [Burkholderiales bacterium]